MAWRRSLLITVSAAMACGAMLLSSAQAQAIMRPIPGPGSAYRPVPFRIGLNLSGSARLASRLAAARQDVARLVGCERQLERIQRDGARRTPTLVAVGASVTAGVGPGNPDRSWAVLVARRLGWDAVVYGDPGAGYVRPGLTRRGPVAREITQVGLRKLDPALVIVQAGHDDMGVPTDLEQLRVKQAITQIRAEAPHAGIALITVFPGRARRAAAYRTDRAIITAARAVDPAVIIMDPLAGRWKYQRVRDGLHPTAAGSAWIAGEVTRILRGRGVHPGPAPPAGGPDSLICAAGIQALPPPG